MPECRHPNRQFLMDDDEGEDWQCYDCGFEGYTPHRTKKFKKEEDE